GPRPGRGHSKAAILVPMAARSRPELTRPLERLHKRIVAGDRGWFFAAIAGKVAERRVAMNMSQRELAALCGTTPSAIARRALGLTVALADVLPWPAGDDGAAREILRLNELIHAIEGVIPLPFHDTLARLDVPWSDDGDHPSVEGHRLLGEAAVTALARGRRT